MRHYFAISPQLTAAFALALLRAHFSPPQFLSAATRGERLHLCLRDNESLQLT